MHIQTVQVSAVQVLTTQGNKQNMACVVHRDEKEESASSDLFYMASQF